MSSGKSLIAMDAYGVGYVEQAIDRAEDAAFNALNVATTYLDGDDEDAVHVITALTVAVNQVREVTGQSEILVKADGDFDYGTPLKGRTAEALRSLTMRARRGKVGD